MSNLTSNEAQKVTSPDLLPNVISFRLKHRQSFKVTFLKKVVKLLPVPVQAEGLVQVAATERWPEKRY